MWIVVYGRFQWVRSGPRFAICLRCSLGSSLRRPPRWKTIPIIRMALHMALRMALRPLDLRQGPLPGLRELRLDLPQVPPVLLLALLGPPLDRPLALLGRRLDLQVAEEAMVHHRRVVVVGEIVVTFLRKSRLVKG